MLNRAISSILLLSFSLQAFSEEPIVVSKRGQLNALYSPNLKYINEAEEQYGLPKNILTAIWKQEQGWLGMKMPNNNGSFDLGPLNVNTVWIKELKKSKIHFSERDVAFNEQVNFKFAAYILKHYINKAKGDIAKGVGWYHTGMVRSKVRTPKKHKRAKGYSKLIFKYLKQLNHQ